jgi:hypothetical protein
MIPLTRTTQKMNKMKDAGGKMIWTGKKTITTDPHGFNIITSPSHLHNLHPNPLDRHKGAQPPNDNNFIQPLHPTTVLSSVWE